MNLYDLTKTRNVKLNFTLYYNVHTAPGNITTLSVNKTECMKTKLNVINMFYTR